MWIPRRNLVIPAKAGIQGNRHGTRRPWTPAFAVVTAFASSRSSQHAAGDETGEQKVPGETVGIQYETADGVWREELDPGTDRPQTAIEDDK